MKKKADEFVVHSFVLLGVQGIGSRLSGCSFIEVEKFLGVIVILI